MKQTDYEKCARRIRLYGQIVFDKMADGKISGPHYTRLNAKLDEWQSELERKKPRQRAAK